MMVYYEFYFLKNIIKSSQMQENIIQKERKIRCIPLVKLGVDEYKNERLALIYALNPKP